MNQSRVPTIFGEDEDLFTRFEADFWLTCLDDMDDAMRASQPPGIFELAEDLPLDLFFEDEETKEEETGNEDAPQEMSTMRRWRENTPIGRRNKIDHRRDQRMLPIGHNKREIGDFPRSDWGNEEKARSHALRKTRLKVVLLRYRRRLRKDRQWVNDLATAAE